jgi:hypothetical protein
MILGMWSILYIYRYVISTLETLVAEDYMIVYFHGATPRRQMPSFGWLKKCYQMIDRRYDKLVHILSVCLSVYVSVFLSLSFCLCCILSISVSLFLSFYSFAVFFPSFYAPAMKWPGAYIVLPFVIPSFHKWFPFIIS